MDLLKKFENHIIKNALFTQENHLLIALSGGVDSMVLAHLCHALNYSITLAHCNFQLRGEESIRDQHFVEAYSRKKELEIFVKNFETESFAAEHKLSIQEAARELRYSWLHQLAENLQTERGRKVYILTAHHADDQIETSVMHFFRGTGLKGLTGIPERNGRIVRPLLSFTKSELLVFAQSRQIAFVQDSTNLKTDYTRNFFRNEMIPLVEKVYPSVRQNLLDNIHRFKSVESLYQTALKPILKKLLHKKGKEVYVPVKELFRYNNTALIYELIHGFGFTEGQIEEVIKLRNAVSGSYIVAPISRYRLIKHRAHFVIAPPVETTTDIITIHENDHAVSYAGGTLKLAKHDAGLVKISAAAAVAMLDDKHITFPLVLRRWKEGDYFYPLGMRKKKKIARFLIDQKLSATEKENVWVLESDSRILWIVGYRIDDRCKITDTTKSVLIIERGV